MRTLLNGYCLCNRPRVWHAIEDLLQLHAVQQRALAFQPCSEQAITLRAVLMFWSALISHDNLPT